MNTIKKYDSIAKKVQKSKLFKSIISLIDSNNPEIKLSAPAGSLKPILISAIFRTLQIPIVIITSKEANNELWKNDLSLLIEEFNIADLTEPEKYLTFSENGALNDSIWLFEGLTKISNSKELIIISTPETLKIKVPNSQYLDSQLITLETNKECNFAKLKQTLLLNGFERTDYVSNQGEIAIRGGIIDIYPIARENPIRIEFFGDLIESIREFNLNTQRSINELKKIEFYSSIFNQTDADTFVSDYILENSIIVVDDISSIEEPGVSQLIQKHKCLYLGNFGSKQIQLKSQPQTTTISSIKVFTEQLIHLINLNYEIIISANGQILLNRLSQIIEENIDDIFDKGLINHQDKQSLINKILWSEQTLSQGFISEDLQIAYFTEHELFHRIFRSPARINRNRKTITLNELKELQIGDFVVHEDNGIGKFLGFEKIVLGDSLQECVKLLYAEGDILYVNLNYIHKLQKYTSEEGVIPHLTKLGSTEWFRKKLKAKKRIKDIARELIQLYSKRKQSKGFAYPTDTLWQKEFEASFTFEDTPDQARTTQEVKSDLENDAPMDRLVCGDVGFGKTEIALRASFKAVQASKQVAMLVPTTILAQQHYLTFKDRLANYPVKIEVLSRFKSKKEQEKIIEELKKGIVDILIGTHRILSKDIAFKDLGVLIIDEEHRFGVSSKEKLRQLRVNVDTLTLTATPIPRTLNFSLLGARDLSIIETPPRNRLPIYTEIILWDDKKIKSAIELELQRNGQVFFVNDKIQRLDKIANKLREMFPRATVGIVHGQMASNQIENIMEKFINGKFDILITTKIIESGLDIPNSNTILINNAENFGLAELYQLRGRVGRANKQAYCYLIIPNIKSLTKKAIQRLQALEEFTDLGSGLQLALRDLEIRGAGNLLGAEQSGFIAEIGFELYHRILEEAVSEIRYEEFDELFDKSIFTKKNLLKNEDLEIILNSDAYIPDNYISSDTERFKIYKQLYRISGNDELQDLINELIDKYGKIPHQLKELFFVVKVRISALNTGIKKIYFNNQKFTLELPDVSNDEFYNNAFPIISEFIINQNNAKIIEKNKKIAIEFDIDKRDKAVEILWRLKKNLETNLIFENEPTH